MQGWLTTWAVAMPSSTAASDSDGMGGMDMGSQGRMTMTTTATGIPTSGPARLINMFFRGGRSKL